MTQAEDFAESSRKWARRPETDETLQPESVPTYHEATQRLNWLRELAASLASARDAVLRSDLAELTRQTARQGELCAWLRQRKSGPFSTAEERWNGLRQESQQLELQVARLNREYAALLTRARRTVDIFCRVLAHSQATYPPPKPESPSLHLGMEG